MFRGYVSTGYNLKCILCPLGKCPGGTCLGGFILSSFAFFSTSGRHTRPMS